MGRTVILDDDLRAKLADLTHELEFRDSAGKLLGYFVPHTPIDPEIMAAAIASVSEEELDRAAAAPRGRSLQEIWRRLGRK